MGRPLTYLTEDDLNRLAQRFYETKGPDVVLRTMMGKESIVSGLKGVFEALEIDILPHEYYDTIPYGNDQTTVTIPDLRVVRVQSL